MMKSDNHREATLIRVGTLAWLAGIVVLGLVGWRELAPDITFDELLYRSLSMIVLAWEVDYTTTIPWALNLSRFMALAFAFVAGGAIVWRALRHRQRMERAKRARNHTVILGDGPEVVALARNQREADLQSTVVVVADRAEDIRLRLAVPGVIVVPITTDGALAQILARATRVVVTAASDPETAQLATRVEACARGGCAAPIALFEAPLIARHWNHGRVTALSRSTQVAIAALRDSPPVFAGACTPPPIVIGDGGLATEVARRMVTGWQQVGEPMTVHCVGPDDDWVEEARAGLESRGEFLFARSPRNPEAVAALAARLTSVWQAPSPTKYRSVGPTVFVALADATTSFSVAASIAEALPEARLTAFVDDPSVWRARLAGSEGRVTLVSAAALLSDPATLALTPERLLTDELLAETGRWPKAVESAFGETPTANNPDAAAVADTGVSAFGGTPTPEGAAAVAAAASGIFAAGNIGVGGLHSDPPEGILSDPEELLAMRDALLRVLPATNHPDQPQRALELAGRLPTLAARAGMTPHRIYGTTNLLSSEQLHLLAQWIHRNYNKVSAATGNATGSDHAQKTWDQLPPFEQSTNHAQAVDIPAKLAALGLTWRHSDSPQVYSFDTDQIEQLARLEHRRWEHNQIRSGRTDHKSMGPWVSLSEGNKEYDRHAVKVLPEMLAELQVEIGAYSVSDGGPLPDEAEEPGVPFKPVTASLPFTLGDE